MDAREFKNLNLEQREEVVLENAFLIGKREEENFRILLFTYRKQYFEVWCSKSEKKIKYIEQIEYKELENYLHKIDIRKMFFYSAN